MLKLSPKPTFKFRVEISEPGSIEPARVTLVGRHMRQSALRAWGERAKEMEGQDTAFLLEAIEGWDEVVDDEGKAVKFSPDSFAAFLDAYPGASLQVFSAYVKELSAGRAKN